MACTDCFLCANLRNRSYCIENIQYTKEEYAEKVRQLRTDSYRGSVGLWERFEDFLSKQATPNLNLLNCTDCFGDNLKNSKNAFFCFDVS